MMTTLSDEIVTFTRRLYGPLKTQKQGYEWIPSIEIRNREHVSFCRPRVKSEATWTDGGTALLDKTPCSVFGAHPMTIPPFFRGHNVCTLLS